jgi:hypothetical protein
VALIAEDSRLEVRRKCIATQGGGFFNRSNPVQVHLQAGTQVGCDAAAFAEDGNSPKVAACRTSCWKSKGKKEAAEEKGSTGRR